MVKFAQEQNKAVDNTRVEDCVLSIMYLRILYDVDMYIYFIFFPYIHFCHQKSNEMIIIIKALGKKPQNYNFGESCKAKNIASSSKDKKKMSTSPLHFFT